MMFHLAYGPALTRVNLIVSKQRADRKVLHSVCLDILATKRRRELIVSLTTWSALQTDNKVFKPIDRCAYRR